MSETMTVTDAVGNAGSLPTIAWRGKTYEVAYATPKAVQRAEEEVARAAVESVMRLKKVFSPAAFAESWASVQSAVQTDQHTFGKSLYTAAMGGTDGLLLPLFACLREKHPEVTMADVKGMYADHPEEVSLLLERVGVGFFTLGVATMTATLAQRAAMVLGFMAFQAEQLTALRASVASV